MFWSNTKNDEDSTPDNEPLSNQSQMISNALRQADKAMRQANYVFAEGTKGKAAVNNPNMDDDNSSEDASSYGDTINDSTIKTGMDSETRATETLASSKSSLNLRKNDTQFHVIAGLICAKFEHFLTAGATSFAVSMGDKQQLDRMVSSRDNFVEAVRYRLETLPEKPRKPIHLLLRQCKALGLHRAGNENLLYAPAGTIIEIEKMATFDRDDSSTLYTKGQDSCTTATDTQYTAAAPDFCVGRDQIMAELREASNLMADSITPEAAQFWRKHVVELQNRLRILQDKPGTSSAGSIAIPGCNEELFASLNASLNRNTSYVPPDRDDLSRASESAYTKGHTPRSKQKKKESATKELDPGLQGLPMIDVVAPANLPEGYTFEAEIDECRFIATVPSGGVRKGETFSCYMRDMERAGESDIPTRKWRDTLFHCLKHGPTHPMLLNACFCPLLGLSQVMTRMGLDFMGLPAHDIPRTGFWSTKGMTTMISMCWVFLNIMIFLGFYLKYNGEIPINGADIASFVMVNVGMFVYIVYAASNTRAIIREKYMIRESCCGDMEDIVFTAVCMPCSISQMGRHTVSYEEHTGLCCSDTGLEDGIEADITARHHVGSYRIW